MTEPQTQQIVRRCRQCREAGHNIRNCPLKERIHQEALAEYQQWIHFCMVDFHFCNKWNYEPNGIHPAPTDINLLQLFLETRDLANPLETVLKTPTSWIKNQSIEHLRVLGHFYNFPKTEPYKNLSKDEWVVLLHFLLFLEVEKNCTRIHDVQEAVVFLSSSIASFPVLELLFQHINSLPLMLPYVILNKSLHLRPLSERYLRVSEMRKNTTRSLRLMQQELNDNYREEVGIRRRINDLRLRRARIENESRRIESRVIKYENEMILFLTLPPDPPKITFHEEQEPATEEIICSICYEPTQPLDIVKLNCKHEFCASCMFQTISGKFNNTTLNLDECSCPYCRGIISKIYGNVLNMKFVLVTICDKKTIPLDLTRIVGGIL